MKIYKYPIEEHHDGEFYLNLPRGSKILTVQMKYNKPCIWVLISDSKVMENKRFKIYATGQNILEHALELRYIGTYQDLIDSEGNSFVWHLFEIL